MSQKDTRTVSQTASIVTIFRKAGGGLTSKVLSLDDEGALVKDGSLCRMSSGTWQTGAIESDEEFASLLESLTSDCAISLGAMNTALADDALTQHKPGTRY
jgi:hypothetical protein